ncbi:MAG: DUF6798 domain-containing protein [Bythopirellula sp.]
MANSSDGKRRANVQRRWLEIALIVVVFFVAGGAPVPHVNETHYLAKAKHYWQPEWCAGDLFLESGKAHVTFYWTVGILTKWFALPTVAWMGRLAAWLALAISWYRLHRSVIDWPMSSVLTAMLLVTLIHWTNFAGEWVVGGVEGKCFAYACVFAGLANLAHNRWHRVWPWLGLAAAFHVLVGGWSVVAAGAVWWLQSRHERPTLKSMLPALMVGGLFALPGVLPALLLTQSASPETVAEANQIYVFDRLPHHLAPLTLPSAELQKKALRFGLLLVGFAWLRYFCFRQLASNQDASASLAPLDRLMRFATAALLISVAGLGWELATWNHPALSARFLKYYWFRLADIALPVAVSLGLFSLAQTMIHRQRKWGFALLTLCLALPTCHLFNTTWARFEAPRPPADRKMNHYASYRAACDWIRENTPQAAVFLVPRRAQSFKWNANRSDLVTWKDVPQNAADLITWRDRYFHVHSHYNEDRQRVIYRSLAAQGTDRIRKLAEQYKIDFVLTKEYPPLFLPVVYGNAHYTLYSVAKEHRPHHD